MPENQLLGVDEPLRRLAAAEAQSFVAETAGVRAVVVATVDGFEVAASTRNALDAQRLAALASSLAAIGTVVSGEAGLGRSSSVTVGTDDGFAVVHAAARAAPGLVVIVVAGPDAVLGQVNYRAAASARRLAQA